jgi:hypothetical protein
MREKVATVAAVVKRKNAVLTQNTVLPHVGGCFETFIYKCAKYK